MRHILLVILTFFCTATFGQTDKSKLEFSIRFASCFDNDIIGLKINGVQIFDTLHVTTYDKQIDITEIAVYQNDKGFWLMNGKQQTQLNKIQIKDILTSDITLNGQLYTFRANLKKGKIIFFDYCFVKVDNKIQKKLTIKQFKKKVELY